jgi:multiple sugar transport system substrate-binding protein
MTETDTTAAPEPAGVASRHLGRREVIKGMAALAGLGILGSLLQACDAGTSATSAGALATDAPAATPPLTSSPAPSSASATSALKREVTLASYLPLTDLLAEFTRQTGIEVKVNTVDSNDFADRFDAYLAATPEDVFTLGTGYEMRASAAKGLLTPIDDVWERIGSTMHASLKLAASGEDHHQYAVPSGHYPWAVFYRKSLFRQHGYEVPTTWEAFKVLSRRMQTDGLIPIAMGDEDLFPAMGWFDIIDMRLNGYQFHIDLLAGKEQWTDPRVNQVFLRWKEVLPYMQSGATARSWGDAAHALANGEAGMFFFGLFFTTGLSDVEQSALDDLDLFPFPRMGTRFDAENAIDAPADSFMIASRSPSRDPDLANAKALLEFMATGPSQASIAAGTGVVATSTAADTAGYSPLQRRASDLLNAAGRTAQFFDRDTDKAFAYRVEGLLHEFLDMPDQDSTAFLERIQAAWPKS